VARSGCPQIGKSSTRHHDRSARALGAIGDGLSAALDDHYAQYPEARPDLADIAIAAAEIDGNPLAADPERIRRAAAEIAATHPDPEPEDVLLWAEARAFPS
jgi:hypothetical protein